MEMFISLNQDEKMSNFGLAEAIYNFCNTRDKLNVIDVPTIIRMLEAQTLFDARRCILNDGYESQRP